MMPAYHMIELYQWWYVVCLWADTA